MNKRLPKTSLSWPLTLACAVLLSGGITLLALWCQPNALRTVLSGFLRQPLLIVLNALPVGLLVLAGTFLLRNVFFSAAAVNLIVCGLSVANRVKIEVRDEPVFPRDFALLKEVGSAVRSYDIRYPVAAIAAVLVITALLILAGLYANCAPLRLGMQEWAVRVLGTLGSIAVLAGLILTVYASNDLYNSFRTTNPYYIPSVFNELGFPYCFCHQFTTYPVDRPDGFSKSEAAAWETGDVSGQGAEVSVIMVMNEAFSDLTDAPVFTYGAADDPLPNLHALRQDPHALSGSIVVPGFAGGTANTEFDVLTGMQTNALSASTTSSFRVVNRNLDSLFRVFAADGYDTAFLHPGDDWFYNRENVYHWLGAEETRFVDELENLEYKGRWVTDDSLAAQIEDAYAASNAPLFHFTTTIQNHMSYTADKYGADYDYPPLKVSVPLSEEVRTLLEVYIEGARDADAMLGRLHRYFAAQKDPVVLIFWGDHLPYLGDNRLAYAELGLDAAGEDGQRENPFSPYETPYVIWANDAAAAALDWENAVKSLDLPDTVSASFFGAAVLELTGRGDSSPWFAFLNELRREIPVVQKSDYRLVDGEDVTALSTDQDAQIQKWRRWSYYKLCYKDVP